jgi:uncharacterized YccA/Bax inhibitor family protein
MTANTSGSLTTTQVNHLNNMNRAAQDVALGTRLKRMPGNSGTYTLVLADTIGTKTTVFDGFTGEVGYILQAYRSGSAISGSAIGTGTLVTWGAYLSGSSLVVKTGSSVSGSAFTTGDVLNYMIF